MQIKFISQLDGSQFQYDNCNMAAGAMWLYAASGGDIDITGAKMRELSGDKNQDGVKGTTLQGLDKALGHYGYSWAQYHSSFNYKELMAAIDNGAVALIHINNGRLSREYRMAKNFTGGHAILVAGHDRQKSMAFVLDPYGRRPYNGHYIPDHELHIACDTWTGTDIVEALLTPAREVESMIVVQNDISYNYVVELQPRAVVHDAPDTNARVLVRSPKAAYYIGYVADEPGWLLVAVESIEGDGAKKTRGGYIHRRETKGFVPIGTEEKKASGILSRIKALVNG